MKDPLIAPCCQRIIGCNRCVERWLQTSARCPLCSVVGRMRERLQLKGFDDVTAIFNVENADSMDNDNDNESDHSDFLLTPRFRVPPAPTDQAESQ